MFNSGSIPHTPYDLKFTLFGIPTRFHPGFFIVMAVCTYPLAEIDPSLWIAAILLTGMMVYIHELGHALAAKAFGAEPIMTFYWLGGLASPDRYTNERWKRVMILLAGPGAGLALAGICYLTDRQFDWSSESKYLAITYSVLCIWALYFNLFNLTPIFPLDGGQLMMEAFTYSRPFNGPLQCVTISFWLAVAYVGYSAAVLLGIMKQVRIDWFILPAGMMTLVIFLMIAQLNWQLMQSARRY